MSESSLFESPIYALGADNLFLWDRATSLNYQEKQMLLGLFEKSIKFLISEISTIFLDDLILIDKNNNPSPTNFVLFNHDFYCKNLPSSTVQIDSEYCQPALLYRNRKFDDVNYKIEMNFDPRFLVSTTSFVNLSGRSIVSGLGMFLGCTGTKKSKLIKIRPLALGSCGYGIQGLINKGEMKRISYDEFKYYRNDIMKYIKNKTNK